MTDLKLLDNHLMFESRQPFKFYLLSTVNSDLLLYAGNTCLMSMSKDIKMIEEQLNTDFSSVCDWFIDNKLSVHFGEEKTKSILFGTKQQLERP